MRPFRQLALLALMIAAGLVQGCGQYGPLELPPVAATQDGDGS